MKTKVYTRRFLESGNATIRYLGSFDLKNSPMSLAFDLAKVYTSKVRAGEKLYLKFTPTS